MHRALSLLSLLVLGSAWIVQAAPGLPESLITPQESFDLDKFMGRWYEVAVVSTCPYYMQRKRGHPVILTLELKHVSSQRNFTMIATTPRNDSCTETSTVHSLTDTPGRFFHHVARFGADVDSFVVHTNYNESAMMVLEGTEKPAGIKTTTVKLYSRTVDIGPAVLDHFKTLVRQHGMSSDSVIMNQYKGECVPGERVAEPTTHPQIKKKCGANCD